MAASTQYDVLVKEHNSTGNAQDQVQTPAFAATLALDASLGGNIVVTLTGNVTSWSIINPQPGQHVVITFVQDATGSRTLASAASNIKFMPASYLGASPGSAPTLTTTANKRDTLMFRYDGTNFVQYGQVLGQ